MYKAVYQPKKTHKLGPSTHQRVDEEAPGGRVAHREHKSRPKKQPSGAYQAVYSQKNAVSYKAVYS